MAVGGAPDLTRVKLFSVPLYAVAAGVFLLFLAVLIAVVAKRKGEPDIGYHSSSY